MPTFRERFTSLFGRSVPFPIPVGVTEAEWFVMSDPDTFDERMIELFGWNLLQKVPAERFFCAGLQELGGTGTLFLLEKRPTLTVWFRQDYRSPFEGAVSPSSCLADLLATLEQAVRLDARGGGTITFNKGSLTIKDKAGAKR